nr:DNA (cytosine-5)-methyltransferase CMT2-like [Tanacetum cinerariifolium]
GEGKEPLVGRIVEFFKTSDDQNYFRVQWYFRAEDTVLKQAAALHDKKRLFYSTLMNDNLLDCIISKLGFLSTSIQPSEYYCDMEYSIKYSTFRSLVTGKRMCFPSLFFLPSYIFLALERHPGYEDVSFFFYYPE